VCEAKRFTFIVFADFLADADAVNDDWSDFRRVNRVWQKTEPIVQDHIRQGGKAGGARTSCRDG
jgi:hypothetical protein